MIILRIIGVVLYLLFISAVLKLIFVACERGLLWLLSKPPVLETKWLSAIVVGFFNIVWVSDLLVGMHSKHMQSTWSVAIDFFGMATAFCGSLFLFIFIDKRTRLRGVLALLSWVLLVVIMMISWKLRFAT